MSVNKLLRIFGRGHEPDIEALSSRLDGRLDAGSAGVLDAHVSACDVCAPALEGLRHTQALLRAMPVADVPRSFRLRQADVEAPVRRPVQGSSVAMRWAPALGGMAAALFVVVLGADLVTRSGSSNVQLAASRENTSATGNLPADHGYTLDSSAGKAQGDVANAPAPAAGETSAAGTTLQATTPEECSQCARVDGDEASSTPRAESGAERPATGSEPTGSPPNGDVNVPAPQTGAPPGVVIPADTGLDTGVATAASAEVARVDVAPAPSPVGELSATSSEYESQGEGNRTGYLIVEIAAAAVAVGAGATLLFWRARRKGAA